MGKNRYVGHRYIPIFENGWDKTRTYEPLTFVYYEGKTYVSRQLVPTNIEITNNDFWAFFMDNAPQIFTPTFTGQWEDKPYEPLSIIVNNGNTYVSKQNVPVGTLLTNTTYWLDLSTYYNQLFIDYETAEQERQQAELIRIENENKRKVDKVVLKNEVDNGDFSQGKTGWTATSSIVIDNNTIHVKSDNPATHSIWQDIASVGSNDKFYVSLDFNLILNPENRDVYISIRDYGTFTSISSLQANIQIMNQYQTLSTIVSSPNGIRLTPVYITNPGYEARLTNVMAFNLTTVFGAGNEPSKEEMDELIKITGYIDGENALNNKEMLVWTLSLIRKNKNAIISLGGTI